MPKMNDIDYQLDKAFSDVGDHLATSIGLPIIHFFSVVFAVIFFSTILYLFFFARFSEGEKTDTSVLIHSLVWIASFISGIGWIQLSYYLPNFLTISIFLILEFIFLFCFVKYQILE
tara:strand:+ start:92 stop:442 length:351 start_codon:yes stop_codon:yes gene_type:complete